MGSSGPRAPDSSRVFYPPPGWTHGGLSPALGDWSCPSLVWMLENSSSKFQTHRKVLISTLLTRPSNATCKSHTLRKRPRLIIAITKRPAQSANTLPAVNGTPTFPSKNWFLYLFFAPLHKSDCRSSNQGSKAAAGSRCCCPKSTLFTRSCDLRNQLEPRFSVSPAPRLLAAVFVKLPVYSFNPGDHNSGNSERMFCLRQLMHSHGPNAAWVEHILTTEYEWII